MRSTVLLSIVVIAGCTGVARKQHTGVAREQRNREVIQWLEKLPHVTIWGVSKWETDDERVRAATFDIDRWIADGQMIADVELMLQSMLERSDASVDPSRVAFAIGRVGTAESIPALIECLNSEDHDLQLQAVQSLGRLRGTRAVHALGSRLMLIVEHDEGMLTSIISALGEIGDEHAVEYLRKAANAENPSISEHAKQVLTDEQRRSVKK